MFSKNILLMALMPLLLVGCESANYPVREGGTTRPPTQAELGVRYLLGRGVPQSDAKAFGYFSEAADSGDAFAQNEVAYMYAAGKGTSQDYSKAFTYYEKAANQGLASAEYNLAIFYKKGLGTEPNPELAKQWLQKSANKGFLPAKKALAANRTQ